MVDQDMPAFPNTGNSVWSMPPSPGMTLRDWFAGQALSGLLASEAGVAPYPYDWAAERSFILADAMLAARSKP